MFKTLGKMMSIYPSFSRSFQVVKGMDINWESQYFELSPLTEENTESFYNSEYETVISNLC